MSHTPGPWEWKAIENGWDGVESKQDGVLCRLVYNNPANAQLMAAAPDLLEACKRLVSVLIERKGTEHEMRVSPYDVWKIKAAIKKAEGKS
jgi:hypothetical protein